RNQIHPKWYIRCVLLLVAVLHTRYHVSFRACALILVCMETIFMGLPGNLLGPRQMPLTLGTTFSHMGLQDDKFTLHIVCPECHQLFPRTIDSATRCPECTVDLFAPAKQQLFQAVVATVTGNRQPPSRKPHLVAPIQLLSDGLRDLFQRPGMLSAMNLWKVRHQVEGESRSIQDGEVWNTIKDHNGHKFFFAPGCENEIRLGVSFSLDWFGRKTSNFGPSHSSGVMSF
ncbi:hypothetical protein R3P38DRAFT_2405770, partial [Favolaschia claudopus]